MDSNYHKSIKKYVALYDPKSFCQLKIITWNLSLQVTNPCSHGPSTYSAQNLGQRLGMRNSVLSEELAEQAVRLFSEYLWA